MKLNNFKTGEKALIIKINAEKELKKRLYSFGIAETEIIEIGQVSLDKQTIELIVNMTSIAIRFSEAEKISVDKIG